MKGHRAVFANAFFMGTSSLSHSATEAGQNICAAVRDGVLQRLTVFKCFKRFREGNVEAEDKRGTGRLIVRDR
ncbi:unnamed protein product [Heligmosomoides polygyrus]|uniref:HTH_48 domain-containing protein n=1 Tax=Heligmosomoides polygyrus TaxID=6339 RepID=A0A183F6P9_HELPZ|nr:unnamed protein product [Heligmosomoides polygyrus]